MFWTPLHYWVNGLLPEILVPCEATLPTLHGMDWEKQNAWKDSSLRVLTLGGEKRILTLGKEGAEEYLPLCPYPLLDQLRPSPLESSSLAKIWTGPWPSCWNCRKNLLDTRISLQPNKSIESQCPAYSIGTLVEFLPQTSSWWLWEIPRSSISRPVTERHWESSFGAGEIYF